MPKAIVLWSGGKDSALALWEARQHYDVAALLTTVTADFDRISMHGVRTELLRQQAAALGYPLHIAHVSHRCGNADYERAMHVALHVWRDVGANIVVAGDLFLEDIRRYRAEHLVLPGMTAVFPLWQRDTRRLARAFLDVGFRAVLCCVDTQALPAEFAGRLFDEDLLADLPSGVDPCGENGEFHTFVFDGPSFAQPVEWTRGERVLRDERFAFCDLLPRAQPVVASTSNETPTL